MCVFCLCFSTHYYIMLFWPTSPNKAKATINCQAHINTLHVHIQKTKYIAWHSVHKQNKNGTFHGTATVFVSNTLAM